MIQENNKNSKLVWIDLEMTGLEPETDHIIEIATIITDSQLNIIARGPEIAIHQPDSLLDAMDEWNQQHHGESGLIDRVKKSTYSLKKTEQETLDFLKKYIKEGESPLCGNSIGQDRRFLCKYMKKLEAFLHYRNLDVSSLKEVIYRWYPDFPEFKKENKHTALEDIQESIEELKYYKKNVFPSKTPSVKKI